MSYGIYSEIYMAVPQWDNPKRDIIKIGETTNSRRRSIQLEKKEGLTISEWVDTNLTHSERLFVESALRIKMEKMGLSLVGNDHFICDESQWRKILKEFPNLVNEMISLIEKI